MRRPNVICLVIDRLHAGYLGAYGNTWTNTPAIDRLASQSFVLDRAITDSTCLDSIYRSLWLGIHALCPSDHEAPRDSLPAIFSRAGWQTTLITDEKQLVSHPLSEAFAEKVFIEPQTGPSHVAFQIEDTDAVHFFAASESWLKTVESPFLLWLHTGTLSRIWDAPLEFRQQFADAEDPSPNESAKVPHRLLPEGFDADELLSFTHAYAGQLSLIDRLLDSLLKSIDASPQRDNTVLVFCSPRGISLGEHRQVGLFDDALYAELTHVPWMIRLPSDLSGTGRSQHLVQPPDWSATLLDSCELAEFWKLQTHTSATSDSSAAAGVGRSILPLILGEQCPGFDCACVVSPNQYAFITPVWSLRTTNENSTDSQNSPTFSTADQSAQPAELFVKPDDWFEVNEVSNRCPDIVEKMQTEMSRDISACRADPTAMLATLPDELLVASE